MNDIMTYDEFAEDYMKDKLVRLTSTVAEAYAHYYAHALIDGLTDEDIMEKYGTEKMYLPQSQQGAKWARETLKQRIK